MKEIELIDSGVQWIREVPKNWTRVRCKDVLRETKIQVGEDSSKYTLLSLTINGIIVRDLSESKGKFPKEFNTYKIVKPNELVFCLFDVDETPRTVGLVTQEGMLTGAYSVFSVRNVDVNFLYRYFISLDDRKALKPLYRGLRKVIPLPAFLSMPIYLPSLSEQRAIADWLDAKCADIDASIELQQRMIDKLKAYKTAVIHQAVTKGLDKNLKPTDLKDSGIKWLGMIPKHWDILRAKNIFVRKNRLVREEDETITCFRDGQVTLRKNRRSDGFTEAVKEIGYQGVRIGDLVIHQMDAFAGAIGVSDSDGKSSPVYICLRPKIENCINQYYAYLLREMARAGFIRALYRGIRERSTDFRFETFANVSLPVPTLEEQRDIIDYIDAKCADIDATIALKEQKQEKLKEYKKTIIFEYVTGKKQVANINKQL
jgi:putative type I site-specific restriction-modification system, S subunit